MVRKIFCALAVLVLVFSVATAEDFIGSIRKIEDGKITVATSESTSMAHVIDNASNKLIANVLVDSRPREAKFTPDGKELWVSSEVGGTI